MKKYGNLQTSFPGLEKVWKIEIKSEKNGNKSGFFFHSTCITSARLLNEMFVRESDFM